MRTDAQRNFAALRRASGAGKRGKTQAFCSFPDIIGFASVRKGVLFHRTKVNQIMINIDRDKLPFHRFLRWIMDNQFRKGYLIAIEVLIAVALIASIYLYFYA